MIAAQHHRHGASRQDLADRVSCVGVALHHVSVHDVRIADIDDPHLVFRADPPVYGDPSHLLRQTFGVHLSQIGPRQDATRRLDHAEPHRDGSGGRWLIWVYGKEGNELYVRCVQAVRAVTTRLPHAALAAVCNALNLAVDAYILACRWLPLPLRDYMRNTLSRVSRAHRKLTIYDQLNPSYAKYYRAEEVREMLERAGFRDVRLHHRRGYSWTAVAERPA